MQGQQIPSQQTPGDKRASNLKTPTPSKRKTVRTWVTSSLLQSVAGRASTPSFAVSKQTPVPQKGLPQAEPAQQSAGALPASPGPSEEGKEQQAPVHVSMPKKHLALPFVLPPMIPSQEPRMRPSAAEDPKTLMEQLRRLRQDASQQLAGKEAKPSGGVPRTASSAASSTPADSLTGKVSATWLHREKVEEEGNGGHQGDSHAGHSEVLQQLAEAEVQPPVRADVAWGGRHLMVGCSSKPAGALHGDWDEPTVERSGALAAGFVPGQAEEGWNKGGFSAKLERLRQLQKEGEEMLIEAGH